MVDRAAAIARGRSPGDRRGSRGDERSRRCLRNLRDQRLPADPGARNLALRGRAAGAAWQQRAGAGMEGEDRGTAPGARRAHSAPRHSGANGPALAGHRPARPNWPQGQLRVAPAWPERLRRGRAQLAPERVVGSGAHRIVPAARGGWYARTMKPPLRARMRILASALAVALGVTGQARAAAPLFVPPFASFATRPEPFSVAIVDLDSDGRLDLVSANYGDFSASSLLGNGDGTFATHTDYLTGDGPWTVTAGDLNGDGHPDVVLPAANSFWLSVLKGH